MGSGVIRPVSEAEFIYLGMTKEKWPQLTPQTIQSFLDDPSILDDNVGWEDFLDCFYKYYDWYWRERRLKQ